MTNPPATSLSAADCLARGGAILRANWRLVPLRLILVLAMSLLSVMAMGLPVLVTGRELLTRWPESPAQWRGWVQQLIAQIADHREAFAISLVGTFLLLTVVLVVWSFTEAGSFGVLYSADRQAPAQAPAGVWFETFSMRDFFGWGGATVWRFLALILIYYAFILVLALLGAGLVRLAIGSGGRWGTWTGLGLGCGGALPLIFLILCSMAVVWLAKAGLSVQGSGAWAALGLGARILSRRLGTVLVLFVVWIVAAIGSALILTSLTGVTLRVLGRLPFPVLMAGNFVFQLIQILVAHWLQLWFAAAFVVLVRSERVAVMETMAVSTP